MFELWVDIKAFHRLDEKEREQFLHSICIVPLSDNELMQNIKKIDPPKKP